MKLISRILLVLTGVIFTPINAQELNKETDLKAGFVYNFTKFIEWPNNANHSNFNLCLVGNLDMKDSLGILTGRMVNGKPIALLVNVNGDQLKNCQLVYVDDDDSQTTRSLLKELNSYPILTVSDNAYFVEKGGMIGLMREGNRLGFEVNLSPVNASGLHISSQLLKLAKDVKGLK